MSLIANAFVSDPALAAPIAQSADWRSATLDLITFLIGRGDCFSSGEIATALRVHRTDLRFSVPNLGEYVRDLFYGGSMPQYKEDDGTGQLDSVSVSMSPRTTQGLYPDRTPEGVQVFVYGPSQGACDSHEFEVFIPNPSAGETMASAPVPATPTSVKVPKGGGVFIGGAQTPLTNIQGKVWPDGRLSIPRSAFEACVHMNGTSMRGGDPVYVKCSATEAVVTLTDDGTGNAKSYDLTRDNGRIAFKAPAGLAAFVPGDTYDLVVTAGKITVAL